MSIIFQKPYSYLLVQNESGWYLTFFTGGPVEIDICVALLDEEVRQVANSQAAVEELISKYKSNRQLIEGRRIIPSIIQ